MAMKIWISKFLKKFEQKSGQLFAVAGMKTTLVEKHPKYAKWEKASDVAKCKLSLWSHFKAVSEPFSNPFSIVSL